MVYQSSFVVFQLPVGLYIGKAGHPDATNLTGDFSPGNSDAMDILTLWLGRVLGFELGRQDVPGLKNTGVNFLASGCRGPIYW